MFQTVHQSFSHFDPNNNSKLDLQAKVAARRKYITEFGSKKAGIAPGCGPNKQPKWFDREKFSHAQRLFRRFEIVIRISQFYGMFLVTINPKVAGTLRATGNNRTVALLYQRFISTMIHIGNWFKYDPFDPASKSYRSLMVVRGYHRQVYTKLNELDQKEYGEDEVWLSQERMCIGVFEFIDFMTLFPKETGFGCFTPYDFHCMFHFWRVIGYCLGIEDRFNFCNGTDEEIKELCRQIYTDYWLPKLHHVFRDQRDGLEMYRGLTLGLARYMPIINFNVFLNYGSKFLQLDAHQFPLETLWEKAAYFLLRFSLFLCNNSKLLSWVGSNVTRFFFWLSLKLSNYHETILEQNYKELQFSIDSGCPFHIKFNYKTAMDLNLY